MRKFSNDPLRQAILLAVAGGGLSLALVSTAALAAKKPAATSPPPVVLSWTAGTATVDGDYSEWNLNTDAATKMCEAGKIDGDGNCDGKVQLSTLYSRYDCNTNTMYILVLKKEDDHTADGNRWVKIYDLSQSEHDIDIADVIIGGASQGYEASFILDAGTYKDVEVHINIDGGRTSSTAKFGGYTRSIEVPVDCDVPVNTPVDTDDDNIADDVDNCPLVANSGQENADGDNMGDACDDLTDTDDDGVADDADNCPLVANSGQENADNDNMGDACDDDTDGDSVANENDNCPLVVNQGQENADNDNMGDACDDDTDGDSIANENDNCPAIANSGQENADGDEMGDACDDLTDSDGDNVADDADNCPAIANSGQENADGDEMGDACDDTPEGNTNDTGNPNQACSEIMDANGNPMSLIAKYETKEDGSYVFEKGSDSINIDANLLGGTWSASDGVNVAAIIIKGGTDTEVDRDGDDSFSNAGLENGGSNTPDISNIQFCGSTVDACDYIYGVHDKGKNNTQFLRYSEAGGIEKLGPLLPRYDIEALDVSPAGELYGASGDDTDQPGYLYQIDMGTGAIIPPKTGTTDGTDIVGCNEVDGISFNPVTGELWGWDQGQGLVTIADDGACSQVVPNHGGFEVEDLSWDNSGQIIYFTYNHHDGANLEGNDANATYHIGKYSVSGEVDWEFCDMEMPEVEAIEVLNDGSLLLGYNSNNAQRFTVVNESSCVLESVSANGSDYDVEGLAVCPPPIQEP